VRPVKAGITFLLSLACMGAASPAFALAAIPPGSLVVAPAELPGLSGAGVKLRSATSASRYVKAVLDERGADARHETSRLRRRGFREGVEEQLSTANSGGLSLALVFGSANAAGQAFGSSLSEALEAQGKATVKRFSVNAIPGSSGFTAFLAHHPGAAANVLFATGRCFFLLGDSFEDGTPENAGAGPIAAATALYGRVKGLCA
jgi:hypothetical protein